MRMNRILALKAWFVTEDRPHLQQCKKEYAGPGSESCWKQFSSIQARINSLEHVENEDDSLVPTFNVGDDMRCRNVECNGQLSWVKFVTARRQAKVVTRLDEEVSNVDARHADCTVDG
jgi:hypothetical protein